MRYLYLLLIPLMACHKITRTPLLFHGKGFVLSDTLYNEKAAFEEYNGYAYYPVYYKGRMHDTIGIASMFIYGSINNHKHPDKAAQGYTSELELFVDTSVETLVASITYKDSSRTIINSIINKNAYLLIVRNTGDSSFFIGDSHFLRSVFREVKNNKGEWIRIEEKLDGPCIKKDILYLKPEEIIISKCFRYKGNMRAPCRIVLSNLGSTVYSNVFVDNVDSRLLE